MSGIFHFFVLLSFPFLSHPACFDLLFWLWVAHRPISQRPYRWQRSGSLLLFNVSICSSANLDFSFARWCMASYAMTLAQRPKLDPDSRSERVTRASGWMLASWESERKDCLSPSEVGNRGPPWILCVETSQDAHYDPPSRLGSWQDWRWLELWLFSWRMMLKLLSALYFWLWVSSWRSLIRLTVCNMLAKSLVSFLITTHFKKISVTFAR